MYIVCVGMGESTLATLHYTGGRKVASEPSPPPHLSWLIDQSTKERLREMNQLGRPRAKTEEKAPLCLQAYAYDPNPQVITRTVT